MRRSLALVPLLLAAASCGGPQDQESRSRQDASRAPAPASTDQVASSETGASERRAGAGPDVAPTAAPGVAFNYRYAFGLAAERVAEVQEQHAGMCEQLGPDRCRITGMLYRVVDEDDIQARLSFKLEPSIARRFGREGVAAVTRAEGMLVESEISGTDVAPRIRQAGRSIDQVGDDLRRIEARLAGRLPAGERSSLEFEAQQLRAQIRAAQENREEAQESLATTPMTFEYGSGRFMPGHDRQWRLDEMLERAGDNFVGALAVLFIVLVTLLPWAALALLGWLLFGWIRRRGWFLAASAGPAVPPPASASD